MNTRRYSKFLAILIANFFLLSLMGTSAMVPFVPSARQVKAANTAKDIAATTLPVTGALESDFYFSNKANSIQSKLSLNSKYSTPGNSKWSTHGPYGAEIYTIAIDPTDAKTAYVGTAGAGIFKTTDEGNSWIAINNGLGDLKYIVDLVVDTNNSSHLLVSTHCNGLYVSNDGGNSWSPPNTAPSTPCLGEIAISPTNSQIAYVLDDGLGSMPGQQLFKTSDGGSSWQRVFFTGAEIMTVSIDPADSSIIYLGAEFNPSKNETGIYKSLDGGNTWIALGKGRTWNTTDVELTTIAIDPSHPQTIYLGISVYGSADPNGVYKSTDGGSTWSPTSLTGGYWSFRYPIIEIDPGTTQTIYAVISGELNKSEDGGATWREIFSYSGALAISKSSPQTLYITTNGGVYTTNDGGSSWSPRQLQGLTNNYVGGFVGNPSKQGVFYAATSSAFWKTVDSATSWQEISGLTEYVGNMFAGSISVATDNPSIMYASYVGYIYKSIDEGNTWFYVGNSIISSIVIDPRNSDRLYGLSAGNDALYLSTDGGKTWQEILAAVESVEISPMDPYTLYAFGVDTDWLFRSVDDGLTWTELYSQTYGQIMHVEPSVLDPNTVYLSGHNCAVYRSTDKGDSWNEVLAEPATCDLATPIDVSSYDNKDVVFAIQNGSVLMSPDAGNNWTTLDSTGLPVDASKKMGINDINFDESTGNLFLSTDHNGIWVTNIPKPPPPPLVVSGNVGLGGVTLSYIDGSPKTAIANSSGNYSFTIPYGWSGTVTPSKTGYTFSPANRVYTNLQADQIGQDFTGTIVPPTSKPLVVLVHGWMIMGRQVNCNEGITLYPDDQNFDGENGDAIGDIPDWLNNQGFEVWSAHLTTGPDYTASLRSNAICLRDQIAQVRSRAPGGKVILIAHSMGGLVARAYIEDDGLYQNDVKTLITLGSPHQGVPVPWWDVFKSLAGLLKGWTCENQVAACEMTQGIEQFNQQHSIRRTNVEYYTVSGNLRTSDSTWIGRALSAVIPGPDDGLVPQQSGNGLSGSRQALATNEAHTKVFGLFSYLGPPPGDLYSFAYADCIQPVLAGNPNGCQAAAAQSSAATATPSFSALSPIVEGSLSSSEQVTHSLSMDVSGGVVFTASWTGGTVTFTLESPSGQVIDPAYASAHPDEVSYLQSAADQTSLGASYAITTAEAGVWIMKLQAGSVPEGSDYALMAAMESPTTLIGQTDREWYTPGATATLTATLDGLPSSATVMAAILRADGVTDTITLSSIGNYQYQASYSVPNAPGFAEVRLVASGTTASSLPFERGTSLAFQISPNTFTLNNTYADTPSLYPGFSLYQFLNVTVGINATANGTVGLSADLVNGNGNFVAHALTIRDVTTGPTTLTLKFDGTEIFASQHNGPYTLTNILLTDETDATLVTQQAQAVYTTAPYLYTDFASPSRIYLPLVIR